MNPKTKKWIIAGVIGTVTIAGALAYLQYKKIMNYAIRFKGVKIKSISATLFNFDLFLFFHNKSDVKFTITKQAYSVYMNGSFVTKISNISSILIAPKAETVIGLNVQFNPKDVLKVLNKNAIDLVTQPDKIKLTIDMKLGVSLYGIPINIPYKYETTLKEMTTPTPQG